MLTFIFVLSPQTRHFILCFHDFPIFFPLPRVLFSLCCLKYEVSFFINHVLFYLISFVFVLSFHIFYSSCNSHPTLQLSVNMSIFFTRMWVLFWPRPCIIHLFISRCLVQYLAPKRYQVNVSWTKMSWATRTCTTVSIVWFWGYLLVCLVSRVSKSLM